MMDAAKEVANDLYNEILVQAAALAEEMGKPLDGKPVTVAAMAISIIVDTFAESSGEDRHRSLEIIYAGVAACEEMRADNAKHEPSKGYQN